MARSRSVRSILRIPPTPPPPPAIDTEPIPTAVLDGAEAALAVIATTAEAIAEGARAQLAALRAAR